MEIAVADERSFVLVETLTIDQAKGRAWLPAWIGLGGLALILWMMIQKPGY